MASNFAKMQGAGVAKAFIRRNLETEVDVDEAVRKIRLGLGKLYAEHGDGFVNGKVREVVSCLYREAGKPEVKAALEKYL